MDFNRPLENSGFDGQADFDNQAPVAEQDYPMPPMPDPHDGNPGNHLHAPHDANYQQHFNGQEVMTAIPQHDFDGHDALGPLSQCHPSDYDTVNEVPMASDMDFGPAISVQQPYMPSTTHDLSHVQEAYDAYVATYNDDNTSQSVRMQLAKALAVEFLQYYYPASEGYVIRESSLGPIAKHGMNFMLKDENGMDPHYKSLEPLPPYLWKDPRKEKNKTRQPSNAQIVIKVAGRAAKEYRRQFDNYWPFTTSITWHQIEPENITGFEVLKEYTTMTDGVEMTHYRLHTCLAIVLAPPGLLLQIAETNDVHRGDILTDVISRSQHIHHGHGLLLFGNWLELYDFDNGAETQITGNAELEYYEGMVSYEEPKVTMSQSPDDGQRLALDLRTVGLEVVDEVCQMVVRKEVVHFGEHGRDYIGVPD